MTKVADREQSSYLGFPLTVTNDGVKIRTPSGRRVATARSFSTARSCVRAYRRTLPKDWNETEPAASLPKATAGSEREGA